MLPLPLFSILRKEFLIAVASGEICIVELPIFSKLSWESYMILPLLFCVNKSFSIEFLDYFMTFLVLIWKFCWVFIKVCAGPRGEYEFSMESLELQSWLINTCLLTIDLLTGPLGENFLPCLSLIPDPITFEDALSDGKPVSYMMSSSSMLLYLLLLPFSTSFCIFGSCIFLL